MSIPILYSFRRCPYCMRAHLGLKKSGLKAELREVSLSDLPSEMSTLSDSETVPVLQLPDGKVIDESWDILKWALSNNDPDNWLGDDNRYLAETEMLVETNDFSFKQDLDHYKYADRYPDKTQQEYRQACEEFIEELEQMLNEHEYLLADQLTLADIAVFPFIRQFSMVDKAWFDQSPYPKLQFWLQSLIDSELFRQVFQKHELWQPGAAPVYI